MCAKLTFLARCKKRAGLIGPDTNFKNRDGQASVGGGGGGTISAEGGQYLLADYVRGGQFPLADCVRGDRICGGTESAPTPALSAISMIKFTYPITTRNVYGPDCVAIEWFSFYARWVKLLFTMWVAVHIFCFGVFQKNLKKLEALYVVTSLLVPAVI